jgi:hypothetical protein
MKMKKITKFAIFLIFFSFIFLLQIQNAYASLGSWQYRRAINITSSLSTALTDYQVLITLNTQTLISQGKMRDDCGDIRFALANGSLISYWIESGCNTTSTRIWVKVPSIPANSNTTIYVYYGNPSATSLSNPDSTMELFDDFIVANTTKWDFGAVTYSVSNGVLSTTGGSSTDLNPVIYKLSTFSNIRIVAKQYGSGSNPAIGLFIRKQTSTATDRTNAYIVANGPSIIDSSPRLVIDKFTTSRNILSYSGITYTPGGYLIIEFVGNGNQLIARLYNTSYYLVASISITDTSFSSGYVGINSWWNDKTVHTDWIYATKYISPEPTISIGVEESNNQPPTITIYSPQNQTYFYSNNFIFNFSVSDDRSSIFWIKAFLDNNLIYENTSYRNNTIVVLTQNLTIIKSYNFTIWANDTDTNSPRTSALTVIFTIKDYEIQQIIYNTNVYETSQQTFNEVIRYNPDLVNIITADLIWNYTNYQTTQTKNSTHFTLTSQLYIPLVQTNNTQVSFYFTNTIYYANGSTATFNSATSQQNILVAYLLNSVSYANFSTFNNINFTKYLQTNFNITCLVSNQITLGIYANSTDYRNASFNCNGNNIFTISNNIQNDGIYNITPYLRIDFQNRTKILNGTSANFYFDNTPPTINFTQFINIYGFTLTNRTNATISANDINYAICNITLNSNSTNNIILKGNSTTIYSFWNDGINNLTINCIDLVGNQNQTTNYYDTRFKKLILWEEMKNRILQNFTGFTTLVLKNENNGDVLDLKALANPIVYFVEPRGSNFTKLRLEFSFGNTIDTVNRIIHSDLIPSEIRICTHETGTTYFTLYILSSQQTDRVGVVNSISNCYIGAGRTEYTIQNSFGLFVYTIRQNYYLYRILSETERVYLALIDGSIAQYINLDMIQYFSSKPSISFSKEHFIVSKIADKTLVISYLRTDNANTYAIVRIYNNNNLLATLNAENPNDFKLYFDFSTINVTSNIFYIEIETNNGKFGRYFNSDGKVGIIPEKLALVLAFGFFIFGFTLSMRLGVGILGFITALISLMICALSIQTPAITLAEGIFIIVMIFTILTITQEARRVV